MLFLGFPWTSLTCARSETCRRKRNQSNTRDITPVPFGSIRSNDGNNWYKVLGDSVIGCFDSSMCSCCLRWHWNARKDLLIVPELRLLNHGVSSGLVTDRNMWLSILETQTCSFWDAMVVPKNPFSETPQSWVSFDSYNMGLSVPMVVGRGIQREHKLFYQGTI